MRSFTSHLLTGSLIGVFAAGCQLIAGTGDFDFESAGGATSEGGATSSGGGTTDGGGPSTGGAGGVGGGVGGEGGMMLPIECTNGMLDGDETDVDCGGSVCAPCDNGSVCLERSDCASGFCDESAMGSGGGMPGGGMPGGGMPGGGMPGGGTPGGGTPGGGSAQGGAGGAGGAGGMGGGIAASVCAPCAGLDDCADGAYCDAGVCLAQAVLGDTCGEDDACLSGHCADGVCCDAACDGTCVSCLAAHTGGTTGSCDPVMANTDPKDQCFATAQETCGASGAGCNGSFDSPGCKLWPSGTACSASTCNAGTVDPSSTCNGTGTCVDQPPMSCGTYACDGMGTACNNSCNSDGDCAPTAYCDMGNNTCVPKKQNGDGCTATNQCLSGFCPGDDGICCNVACSGTCEACLMSKTGSANGTCDFVNDGIDPDNECNSALAPNCNGSGMCSL